VQTFTIRSLSIVLARWSR